jgi:hypothetical protein
MNYQPSFSLAPAPAPAADADACAKCAGSGRFVSFRGRDCGECFACKGTGRKAAPVATEAAEVANVDKLMGCFNKATAAGLQRPAMRFPDWTASLAPATGKNPGAVYCKRDYIYLGKIVDGRFRPSRDCSPATSALIVETMADPLAAAIAYGRRTGACSCCGRTLSDAKSVSLGIGPICKEKYGL